MWGFAEKIASFAENHLRGTFQGEVFGIFECKCIIKP